MALTTSLDRIKLMEALGYLGLNGCWYLDNSHQVFLQNTYWEVTKHQQWRWALNIVCLLNRYVHEQHNCGKVYPEKYCETQWIWDMLYVLLAIATTLDQWVKRFSLSHFLYSWASNSHDSGNAHFIGRQRGCIWQAWTTYTSYCTVREGTTDDVTSHSRQA